MKEPNSTIVPYSIQTPRLDIRCYNPEDANLLKEAIDESIDRLTPWMPWAADEPTDLDTKIQLLRTFRGNFDLGKDFVYGIFDSETGSCLGGTGLHVRSGNNSREIGYWVRTSFEGKGIISEAVRYLTWTGFSLLDLKLVEIRCNLKNNRSAAVASKAGFRHEATLRRPEPGKSELIDTMVWSMYYDQYPGLPADSPIPVIKDAAGRVVDV